MMKPVIGVLFRNSKSESGLNISYVYSDILDAVYNSGGLAIGVSMNEIYSYIDICDGFILQGGDEVDILDIKIIELLYNKDIPLLGICLGMQEMAIFKNGTIKDVVNHKGSIHEIMIDNNSLLYEIIGCSKIKVNSRHKSAIIKTDLVVGAVSIDGVIEEVEDSNHKFFVGVEWHPESIYNDDIYSKKLFDYFVKKCHN